MITELPAAIALDRRPPLPPTPDLPLTGDWHALYTRHQHEKAVALHLEQMGIRVFLPLYREMRRWSDRRKEVVLPLLPCYVFFSGGLERKIQILNAPGVCSLVASGGRIAVIPAVELEAIRQAMKGSRSVVPCPFLQSGDRIRVHSGPLAGLQGVVIRMKDCMRIVLSVQTLSRSVAVEVDAADIERVITA